MNINANTKIETPKTITSTKTDVSNKQNLDETESFAANLQNTEETVNSKINEESFSNDNINENNIDNKIAENNCDNNSLVGKSQNEENLLISNNYQFNYNDIKINKIREIDKDIVKETQDVINNDNSTNDKNVKSNIVNTPDIEYYKTEAEQNIANKIINTSDIEDYKTETEQNIANKIVNTSEIEDYKTEAEHNINDIQLDYSEKNINDIQVNNNYETKNTLENNDKNIDIENSKITIDNKFIIDNDKKNKIDNTIKTTEIITKTKEHDSVEQENFNNIVSNMNSTVKEIANINKNAIKTTAKPQNKQEVKETTIIATESELTEEFDNDNIEPKTKTVTTESGIQKVDKKTNVIVETVAKFDTVIMSENDVDFFSQLVQNGTVDMSTVTNTESATNVSKTLADMLAKAMEDNKPIRIDFDNDISVIIKIGKDGKISADFLPSSQIAEAYLKENLPLLKQKFDSNNIEYDELNQRKQKQEDKENRKKGRNNE